MNPRVGFTFSWQEAFLPFSDIDFATVLRNWLLQLTPPGMKPRPYKMELVCFMDRCDCMVPQIGILPSVMDPLSRLNIHTNWRIPPSSHLVQSGFCVILALAKTDYAVTPH